MPEVQKIIVTPASADTPVAVAAADTTKPKVQAEEQKP